MEDIMGNKGYHKYVSFTEVHLNKDAKIPFNKWVKLCFVDKELQYKAIQLLIKMKNENLFKIVTGRPSSHPSRYNALLKIEQIHSWMKFIHLNFNKTSKMSSKKPVCQSAPAGIAF